MVLQGNYVVLAAESLCICGVDVAAPPRTRSSRLHTIADLHKAFHKQLTKHEVAFRTFSCAACHQLHYARNGTCCTPQWIAVETAGDVEAQMRMFQTFWSLKEVGHTARAVLPNCACLRIDTCREAPLLTASVMVIQAFVKARGDGLGFDLGKAEFCIHTMQAGVQAATVSVGGQLLDR